jgi:hypothetical protein
MKHTVIGIIGLLMMVLGVGLIILQLMEGGKSVVGSIATGSSSIAIGSVLIGMSQVLKRKRASQATNNHST